MTPLTQPLTPDEKRLMLLEHQQTDFLEQPYRFKKWKDITSGMDKRVAPRFRAAKEYFKEKGGRALTVQELADTAECSTSIINNLNSGQGVAGSKQNVLARLAEHLGVKTEWLIGNSVTPITGAKVTVDQEKEMLRQLLGAHGANPADATPPPNNSGNHSALIDASEAVDLGNVKQHNALCVTFA